MGQKKNTLSGSDYSNIDWPCANYESVAKVKIRSQPADFFVEEILSFSLNGEGEHVYLLVEKTDQNTIAVAERIASFAGVHPNCIGYAGLKDRKAITRQWFSVQLPKVEPADWQRLNADDLKVLCVDAHTRKLRKGAVKSNHFKLVLREVQGDPDKIDIRLQKIAEQGVPNYFGAQRFGRSGENVNKAMAWINGGRKSPGRHLKGLYLSSIRSFLFNQVLAYRVSHQIWDQAVIGDNFVLNGSNSCFQSDYLTTDLTLRIERQDIHPALMLYGLGGLSNSGKAQEIDQKVLERYPLLTKGLDMMKLKKAWRSTRLLVANLQWQWTDANSLMLSFNLPSGAYATSVLSEI